MILIIAAPRDPPYTLEPVAPSLWVHHPAANEQVNRQEQGSYDWSQQQHITAVGIDHTSDRIHSRHLRLIMVLIASSWQAVAVKGSTTIATTESSTTFEGRQEK